MRSVISSMWKEMVFAVILTIIFSFGAGVLFVKPIMDIIEEVFNERKPGGKNSH